MGGFGVKPGRSQSVFQAFAAVIFGCICIGMASVTGGARAPGIFVIVPIAMALLAFIAAGFSVYNAVSTNRMSSFEVMDLADEPDPLSRRRADQTPPQSGAGERSPGAFCPFCGKAVQADYSFCPACGGNLSPDSGLS
jgi:hypothetical protein